MYYTRHFLVLVKTFYSKGIQKDYHETLQFRNEELAKEVTIINVFHRMVRLVDLVNNSGKLYTSAFRKPSEWYWNLAANFIGFWQSLAGRAPLND